VPEPRQAEEGLDHVQEPLARRDFHPHARVAVALQDALAAIDRAAPPRRLRMPRTPTRPRSVSNRSSLAIARGLARRTGLIWHEERLRRWARPLLAARGTTEAPADSGRVV